MRVLKQRLTMYDLAGGRDVLAGAARGKAMLGKLITAISSPAEPEAVFLDFKRVEVATASYLRESVLGYRDYCTTVERQLYPVVANANAVILEELDFVLKLHGDPLLICSVSTSGTVTESSVIGHLNQKESLTLDAVISAGEVDAAKLAAQHAATESIKITGWNNRLATLVAKGILMEVRRGRSKVYRPVLV
jgi:hypothetical protein